MADIGFAEDAGLVDTGAPDATVDAGETDSSISEDAGAFACALPETVTGILDGEVEASLDTSQTDLRPRDLGLLCGNTDPAVRWAPQQIVAYEVPGTGGIAVDFTTRRAGTPTNFDTVVQVRRACSRPPPFEDGRFPALTCFDDWGSNPRAPDIRSEGAIQATGGETLYFVVTGYSGGGPLPDAVDEGPVELVIGARTNTGPTLNDATAFVSGNDVIIRLDGDDPDADVRGSILNFRIGGELFDIFGAGFTDPDVSALVFDRDSGQVENAVKRPPIPLYIDADPPLEASGRYELLASEVQLNPPLGGFIQTAGIDQIGIRLYDEAFATTNEVVADVVVGAATAGYGEACERALCQRPLRCEASVCAASERGQATCDPANVVDSGLAPAPGVYAADQVATEIPAGPSGFVAPSCVREDSAEGAEVAIAFTVPSGGQFDLLADTENDVTGPADTLVHLRSDCMDPRTEVAGACNDDRDDTTEASAIEVRDLGPGTYSLVVERWTVSEPVVATDVAVDLALRPVVGEGEACDVAEIQSRCGVGTCQPQGMGHTCQP